MDTATIETLEKMRDEIDANIEYLYCDKGIAQKVKVYALDKVLSYIRTMGEIEAVATEIWFGYGRSAKTLSRDKDTGKWSDEDAPLADFASLADAWEKVKEQK